MFEWTETQISFLIYEFIITQKQLQKNKKHLAYQNFCS